MARWRRIHLIGLLCVLLAFAGPLPGRATAAAQGSTFVFFEKFPDDNPNQWNVQKLPDGSQTYLAGGSYHIVRTRPGTMRGWPLQVKVPVGFQFNVRLQIVTGKQPYAGITFWDDLQNDFMLFAITDQGQVGLFKHTQQGYKVLMNWRAEQAVRKGLGAINSLSVNLDERSAATGRTFLINGRALARRCKNLWRTALGRMPAPPKAGLFVGVLAGAYDGATQVTVLRASMYDGTNAGPVRACPASHS